MAATRLIALHINKGKTVAQCLADRTDYSENAAKTEDGKYISAYACDAKTCDEEFLLSKRQYEHITGRTQAHDVIAYQIRQSFKPGEITPEEANKVGYEAVMRFTKGKHAFIVATHVDRAHIHNHIIFNSTTLDCTRKFRDFAYPVLHWRGSVISSVWSTGCRSLSGSPMGSGRRERNTRRENRSGMKSARPLMRHWKENQKTSGN